MQNDTLTYRGVVYPWQCDHMGHMNVMWYTGKADEAIWNFFADLGLNQRYFDDHKRGMAALEIKTSYRAEVVAGETIEIRTSLTEISEKIIKLTHQMYIRESDKLAAVFDVVGIHLDTDARKSCPFPDDVVTRAQSLLGAS